MKAVICAAGFGTRLKQNIPKAMAMVNGKRIIDYQINALKNYEEIFVVVGFRSNLIVDHLKKNNKIKFILNSDLDLGIMHTMRLISRVIDELALIIDGDIIFNDEIPLFSHEFIGINAPVYQNLAVVEADKKNISVGSKELDQESANIFCTNPSKHDWNTVSIFETLTRSLPKPFLRFDSYKIITPEDKNAAYTWLTKFSNSNLKINQ
jgi:choline kinase